MKDQSAEDKIREAAKRVFIQKGFESCTSREIAKEAGMNVALVNYYFRSKKKLFELIFRTAMEDFMFSMIEVFSTDLSLENKIRIFIEKEYEFLTQHPEIPAFIINELTRNTEECIDKEAIFEKISQTGIFETCKKAQASGEMREIDLVSLNLLITSNCQYPFMAKQLMKEIHRMDDEAYANELILHKQNVIEMITHYLFPKA